MPTNFEIIVCGLWVLVAIGLFVKWCAPAEQKIDITWGQRRDWARVEEGWR